MMEWVVFLHLRHFAWSCFLMEKDNPLENRIKDSTLFSQETDGNLFSRQSDMTLLYGQNINSIAWKLVTRNRITWWSIFLVTLRSFYTTLLIFSMLWISKDKFNSSNILLSLIAKETTFYVYHIYEVISWYLFLGISWNHSMSLLYVSLQHVILTPI